MVEEKKMKKNGNRKFQILFGAKINFFLFGYGTNRK